MARAYSQDLRERVLTATTAGTSAAGGMTAPMVLDGPMTSVWFLAYVEQILVPTLRSGDVVILDNLPAHKGAAPAARRRGRRRQAPVPPALLARLQSHRERLSKLKALLRKAALADVPPVSHPAIARVRR